MIVLCAYAFLLKITGYLVATFALAVFTIRYLNYKKWVVILGFALFVTLLTYGVFNGLLSVPLFNPVFYGLGGKNGKYFYLGFKVYLCR